MRLVVHVQPFATLRSGSVNRRSDHCPPQAGALVRRMHDRIEEEAVYASVPDNVNECHQLTTEENTCPGHAVSAESVCPRRNVLFDLAEREIVKPRDGFIIRAEVRAHTEAVIHSQNDMHGPQSSIRAKSNSHHN